MDIWFLKERFSLQWELMGTWLPNILLIVFTLYWTDLLSIACDYHIKSGVNNTLPSWTLRGHTLPTSNLKNIHFTPTKTSQPWKSELHKKEVSVMTPLPFIVKIIHMVYYDCPFLPQKKCNAWLNLYFPPLSWKIRHISPF